MSARSGRGWTSTASSLLADLAAGASLARVLEFEGPQLRCFGADARQQRAAGRRRLHRPCRRGGSCNCSVLTLTPHANGTHTEGVGHLTREPLDAHRLIPQRLLIAALLTVEPELAGDSREAASRHRAPTIC